MVELSHSELEKPHYQAVRNIPEYRLEGMIDLLREEMSMYQPFHPIEEDRTQLAITSVPVPEKQTERHPPPPPVKIRPKKKGGVPL